MDAHVEYARLHSARRALGDEERTLVLGRWAIRLAGLSEELCGELQQRWGPFLRAGSLATARAEVRLFSAGSEPWFVPSAEMEPYRLEAVGDGARRVVVSYNFAIGAETQPDACWRLALTDRADEPPGRIVENAMRFVAARLSVEDGGLAMHGAGVLLDGRAYLFVGPSRAGKSTAVRLCAPATPIGDDFSLVLPDGEGWVAPALPFDNSERVTHVPSGGPFPVAGIWRLYQAAETRVETPRREIGVASLMGCTAFPWAMPEQSGKILEQVERVVVGGLYRHLHFTETAELWPQLLAGR